MPSAYTRLRRGSLSRSVLNQLSVHGPMTCHQLEQRLPKRTEHICSALYYLVRSVNKYGTAKPKQIYIIRWVRDDQGGELHTYPRPVYAIGAKPDAPKPPPLTNAERSARRRERKRQRKVEIATIAASTPNSIFNWRPACPTPMTP